VARVEDVEMVGNRIIMVLLICLILGGCVISNEPSIKVLLKFDDSIDIGETETTFFIKDGHHSVEWGK